MGDVNINEALGESRNEPFCLVRSAHGKQKVYAPGN